MKTMNRLTALVVAVVLFPALKVHAYFDPSIGRWASRDPLGDSRVDQLTRPGKSSMASAIKPVAQRSQTTLNLYAFVGNTPTTKTDYLGLDVNTPPVTVSAQVACCKCGLSVDGYVEQTLNNITRTFQSADYLTKCAACNDLWIPDSPGYVIDAWDMLTIQSGVPTISQGTFCAPCAKRVTFRGGCYDPADVNYIMWGHITSLCKEEFGVDWSAGLVAATVRAVKAVRGLPVGCAEAFALTGFDGRPVSCPEANWNKICTPNSKRFTGGDPNNWVWEPLRHRNSR